jgi:hypothetical protein
VFEVVALSAPPRIRYARFVEGETGAEPEWTPKRRRLMRLTRRGLQIALGCLWLLDGALQLQPFMFTHGFAGQVIAGAGQGQPGFVSGGVNLAAGLVGSHPVLLNAGFAAAQIALGVGLLIRPAVRLALIASIGWALSVWYLGEGLGGLASGHAALLSGAPGAVLLYGLLALAAWPPVAKSGSRLDRLTLIGADLPPASWLPKAWAVLWTGAALLRALPGQNRAGALAGEVRGSATDAPTWLATLDRGVVSGIHAAGVSVVVALILLQLAIGLAALGRAHVRRAAAWAGVVVSVVFWAIGQNLGDLFSGQATDPNAAPLIALFALGLLALTTPGRATAPRGWLPQQRRQTAPSPAPQLVSHF